jgi:hypothetical protein
MSITYVSQPLDATRTLTFVRSTDPTIASYRIEQQINGGSWTPIAYIPDKQTTWFYSFVTGQLADLTTYAWRVIPIGQAGNDGTAETLGSEYVVCTPPAPLFALAFDSGTTKVTFSA